MGVHSVPDGQVPYDKRLFLSTAQPAWKEEDIGWDLSPSWLAISSLMSFPSPIVLMS